MLARVSKVFENAIEVARIFRLNNKEMSMSDLPYGILKKRPILRAENAKKLHTLSWHLMISTAFLTLYSSRIIGEIVDTCLSLKTISLSDFYFTDDVLKKFSRLEQLTFLDLCRCPNITEVGLEAIVNLTNLTSLRFSHCIGIKNGVSVVSKISNLKILKLNLKDNDNAKTEDLAELKQLINLTSLEILHTWSMTDEMLGNWGASLNKLSSLTLDCLPLKGFNCIGIANFTELSSLFLYCQYFSNADLAEIFKLKKPTFLLLGSTVTSNLNPAEISQYLPNLSSLKVIKLRK